jgi:hypothetical protein
MTEPQPTSPRRGPSRLGLAALLTVLAGFVLPLLIFGIGWAITQGTADSVGGYAVGLGIAIAVGAAAAFPFSVIGIVLAIVALTRRNRGKALAVTALVLGFVPLVSAAVFLSRIGYIVGG